MTILEKTSFCSIFIIMLILLLCIIFSKNGFLEYKDLKAQELDIQERTLAVEKVNRQLEDEIKSLKTDMDYIKHVAKHEHDMAEQDELIFKDKTVKKGNIIP